MELIDKLVEGDPVVVIKVVIQLLILEQELKEHLIQVEQEVDHGMDTALVKQMMVIQIGGQGGTSRGNSVKDQQELEIQEIIMEQGDC